MVDACAGRRSENVTLVTTRSRAPAVCRQPPLTNGGFRELKRARTAPVILVATHRLPVPGTELLRRPGSSVVEPESPRQHDRFGPIARLERAQYRRNMDLDGAFRQIERARNQLVGLAAH